MRFPFLNTSLSLYTPLYPTLHHEARNCKAFCENYLDNFPSCRGYLAVEEKSRKSTEKGRKWLNSEWIWAKKYRPENPSGSLWWKVENLRLENYRPFRRSSQRSSKSCMRPRRAPLACLAELASPEPPAGEPGFTSEPVLAMTKPVSVMAKPATPISG